MDNESQLWRGVVNDFAGKYLGELTVRGNSDLECHQRLQNWFDKWFAYREDVSLTACRLVTRGPVILLARGHWQPQAQLTRALWPVDPPAPRDCRSVPPSQRYR
jgi:hypothetical protein